MAKSRKRGKKKSAKTKVSKLSRAGKRPAARQKAKRKAMKRAPGKARARLLKLPSLKSLSGMKLPKVPKLKAPKIPKAMRISSIKLSKLPSLPVPRLPKTVTQAAQKIGDHSSHLWLSVKPGGQEGEAGGEESETIQKFVKQALAKNCKSCGRPLAGVGGFFSKLAGHKRSEKDPNSCNECG